MSKPQPSYDQPMADLVIKKPIGVSQMSKKAIFSLVFGVASFVCFFFSGIVAIILGVWSLVDIGNPRNQLEGKGLAIAGIVCGGLGSLLTIPLLIGLLLPAVQQVRQAARRTTQMNQLRQIGLGMHNYNSVKNHFPNENFGSGLSWRVHLLPYLEENQLYSQFKMDEPWDSPNNIALLDQMPNIYSHSNLELPLGETVYVVPVSPAGTPVNEQAFFVGGQTTRSFDQIPDGAFNTVLLLEVDESASVPWTKPTGDWQFDPDNPIHSLGNNWPGLMLIGLADGSVQQISNDISPQEFKAYITTAGGETISPRR